MIYAQIKTHPSCQEKTLIEVSDWNQRILFLPPYFWEENRDTVIAQLGIEKFRKVIYNCSLDAWPEQFHKLTASDTVGNFLNSSSQTILYSKLSKLRLYKIAFFDNYQEGKNLGRMIIVEIPYKENVDWDRSATWNVIYFLIPETGIKATDIRH